MLQAGDKAPLQIKVKDHNDQATTLKQLLGKRYVLYFYPKDDTPGCTKEACGIRDAWPDFQKLQVPVYGVSPDSPQSHQKFIEKYELPFNLLCDPEHQLAEAFGAWGEKNMYGKMHMGVLRSSFIIDAKGTIAKAYPKVKPEEHAAELLADLRN